MKNFKIKSFASKFSFGFSTQNRFININNPSVWILFNELASKVKGINMVSGFPNWDPPEFLVQSIQQQISSNDNLIHQRTNANGHPFLLETLASIYSPKYKREINAKNEICVTPGANYAINHSILSLLKEGDELVSFEPFYPEYYPETYLAGGVFKGVPLIPPPARARDEYKGIFEGNPKDSVAFDKKKDEWKVDFELLRKTLNEKTRILLLNNPNNPTGKIFTMEELTEIANILKDFPRIVVINDEVYEKVFYNDSLEDIPRFATLPGMWERSINILSAGKIFSATGIRVGWTIGPADLINPIIDINTRDIANIYPPIQIGVAEALLRSEKAYNDHKNYYEYSKQIYMQGRNRLLKSLTFSNFDFKFWTPEAGYFVLSEFANIPFDEKYYLFETKNKYSKDYAFALWLANERGAVGVPMSVFYSPNNKHLGYNQIRFACCKTENYFQEVDAKLK